MAEDFNKLRMINKKLVAIPFQKKWLFRLDIDGAPDDFDFYVKDVSYNPRDMNTDEEQIGSLTMTWPVSQVPIKVSATMRDNEDGRILKFMVAWLRRAVRSDGTVGLPYGSNGYLKKVRIYWQKEDSSESCVGEWEMFVTGLGELSQSREESAFMEFPASFVQFATGD